MIPRPFGTLWAYVPEPTDFPAGIAASSWDHQHAQSILPVQTSPVRSVPSQSPARAVPLRVNGHDHQHPAVARSHGRPLSPTPTTTCNPTCIP